MPDPIAMFEAGFKGIRLNADGTPNYTFEANEDANDWLTPLARAKANHQYLMVIVYDYEDWERMRDE
jgi:hypothetical protein